MTARVDVGAARFRVVPYSFAVVIRSVAVQPDTLDNAAYCLQRPLAANAMDDEHCGSLVSLADAGIGHLENS
jgi:hypothetical protein